MAKKNSLAWKTLVRLKRSFGLRNTFNDSATYRVNRYSNGGNSGSRSYNHLTDFSAKVINEFLSENQINPATDFGCGDGSPLGLIAYKNYIGFDVSRSVIKICADKYKNDKSESFFLYDSQSFFDNHKVFQADLSLSLDVMCHLIEDVTFKKHLNQLMSTSTQFFVFYSGDFDSVQLLHVMHGRFFDFIGPHYSEWELFRKVDIPLFTRIKHNTSLADFYIL